MLRSTRRKAAPTPWAGEGLAFVVGHPRSGTTFVGRMLGVHPQVGYWEEPRLLLFVNATFSELHRLHQHLRLDAGIDAFTLRQIGNSRTQNAQRHEELAGVAQQRAVEHMRRVAGELVEDFRTLSGRPLVVEKTPAQVGMLQNLGLVLPDAKVVHIIRDPRDVAGSAKAMVERDGWPGWLEESGDPVVATAHQWVRLVGKGLAAEDELGPAVVHRMIYEDLVADAEGPIQRLLDFLGVAWTDEVDEFLRVGHSGGLDPGRAGRWDTRLTPDEADSVVAIAGELMASVGYAADGSWHPPSSALQT